jgi:hypothetical protein
MKTEEIGTVKYGNLRFVFTMSEAVNDYLVENSIESQSLFPQTQFFYQGVLMKLGIDYNDNKELKIVFHGIRLNGEGVSDVVKAENKFDNFPIHVDDLVYFTDFFVEVSEKKD